MAKAIGLTVTLGAKLASSVGSVFDTVEGRAGKLKGNLRNLSAVSTAAGKLTTTKARVDDLRAQSAAGKPVTAELASAERAFASASRSAAKYNVTVANSASVHADATAQIARTEAALQRQQTLMRNRAKRDELKGQIMGTIASAGAVIAPVKIAIDFEGSMADAAKTIDGMRDNAGNLTADYYKMEAAVKSMGRELPLTHKEIASLFAAGGQMGKSSVEELREFTTLSAHMAVAFGMGTDEAADAIGGYQTKLGLTADATRDMLDLMNQYANTTSATEKDIAGIVGRVGALGGVAGIAHKPMTAMAATLASMKIPEEIAATGLKNFMLALSKGDAATKKQQEALGSMGIDSKKLAVEMQKDAEGAMLAVLQKIKNLPKEQQIATMTELFGSESLGAIAPMLTQLDLLKKNFLIAGDSSQFAGAMQKEFENRSKTTANALIITRNKLSEVAITAGSSLLPALNSVLTTVGNGAVALAGFAQANPGVVSAVMYTVAALAAFKVASLAGGYAITIASDAWAFAKGAWAIGSALCNRATYAMVAQRASSMAAAAGTGIMTAAQWALNTAMSANPVGLIIAGVVALGAGLVALYTYCEPVRAAMDGLWEGIRAGLQFILAPLERAWGMIQKVGSWLGSGKTKEAEAKAEADLAAYNASHAPAAKAAPVATAKATAPALQAAPIASAAQQNQGAQPHPAAAETPAIAAADAAHPTPGLPAAAAARSTAAPAGPRPTGPAPAVPPIMVTQQITINAEIKELRREVMDALEKSGPELERILGALLANQQRVTYG